MKQRIRTLFAAFGMAAALPGAVMAQEPVAEAAPAVEAPAAAEPYPGLATFVDGMLATQLATMEISAATISVVKDGEVIFARAYGMQDIEADVPATAELSTFRIGSTSKLFTWTSVMQQVEAGKLDLDADVNTYLTGFQIPATFPEPITLRHILTHTAGFEDGALGFLIGYDTDNMLSLQDAMAKHIPMRVNKPGAYTSYSNYATALAGLIVQNVSGMPFNDYVQTHILDPLGMQRTTFDEPLPERLKDGRTVGYSREMGALKPERFELIAGFAPAGSVSSTATDMARFMMAHLQDGELDGARILKPETARQMHSVIFQGDKRLGGMAHGFYEEYLNGHRLIGHGGDTNQFHTNMLIDKDEQLGIFVSYATGSDTKGRNTFVETFYDRYYPVELAKLTPPADFDERAARYAGSYKFWRHNASTIEKAISVLMNDVEVAPTGEGTLFLAGLWGPQQYVEIDKNLFRQVDGQRRIAFIEDANGNVQDLYIDGLPFMSLSKAPAFESKFFKQLVPGFALILFLTVFTGWLYRRREYKTMQPGERAAIRFSLAVAGANWLFVLGLVIVISIYKETLFEGIPFAFKANLVLPILASLLTIGVIYHAVQAWKQGYWRLGRRVHYTLVALASVYMVVFYYYWNILGFQYATN
ncbi:serine hydrolase domain-containing protein [Gimibacter soli]|uniref:Serine hydrolase n=1 Tax=Gimibacter soli TaxID=3024400 RepID=A0AAE9XV59_9PROT|nr:serine hydrolase domain-containing protein [Gimibacter soli]WCL54318.1 serine hydrolase [Gimibacter soli]